MRKIKSKKSKTGANIKAPVIQLNAVEQNMLKMELINNLENKFPFTSLKEKLEAECARDLAVRLIYFPDDLYMCEAIDFLINSSKTPIIVDNEYAFWDHKIYMKRGDEFVRICVHPEITKKALKDFKVMYSHSLRIKHTLTEIVLDGMKIMKEDRRYNPAFNTIHTLINLLDRESESVVKFIDKMSRMLEDEFVGRYDVKISTSELHKVVEDAFTNISAQLDAEIKTMNTNILKKMGVPNTIMKKVMETRVNNAEPVFSEWRTAFMKAMMTEYSVDKTQDLIAILSSLTNPSTEAAPHVFKNENEIRHCEFIHKVNESIVETAESDIVVRFDLNGPYIRSFYNTHYHVTVNDISISEPFDIAVPTVIMSGAGRVIMGGNPCTVTIYDRDSEEAFNDMMTKKDGSLKCPVADYEDLYYDMWNLNKKVAHIKMADGTEFILNDKFETKVTVMNHLKSEQQTSFGLSAVVDALKEFAHYLSSNTLDGINVTFREKEDDLKGVRRDYTAPRYRKGCVVKAHFRHYKSGVITFVKPHVRRGTNVINGKIVIDIK